MRVLFVFGTRPEAIKLAPVVMRMRDAEPGLEARVCVTAQHRGLLDQVLETFRIEPDHDLNLMTPGQSLTQSASRILAALEPVIAAERPAMLVVQGDTTTTMCGALAAFFARVPVAHVEAGLRTGDLQQPFPEELHRVVTGRVSALHLAPTAQAAANLLREGVPAGTITVTGNSGIDALLHVRDGLESGAIRGGDWPRFDPSKKLLVLTAHRRESFGPGFEGVCTAIERLAARPDVEIAFPMHPNPNVRAAFSDRLARLGNVHLMEPLDYVPFVDLMRRAHLLITDSGGVQEEGPSLGKPILVLREKTERPEAVEAGTVRLVGCLPDRILDEAKLLLDDEAEYDRRSHVHNPYGDGHASERICNAIRSYGKAHSLS
jgi:UDP-N-acetylglucosamine 2-epimerase (non-hydrolysing)